MDNNIQSTLYDNIIAFVTSQDFQQHLNMVISVSLELYRVMISSLLIIFVPQRCDDHVCTLMENLESDSDFYFVGLVMNYITISAFVVMYIFEMRREETLIKLLEVNNTIASDNISVGRRLNIFPIKKREKLFAIDRHYQYISYIVMCIYFVNIATSSVIISEYSLGNQTLVIFLTNILFMVTKLSHVYIIIHTEKNIFLSAYLNTKVQFNDIDPHELVKLEKLRPSNSFMLQINNVTTKKVKFIEGGGFAIDSSDSDKIESSDSDNDHP